MDSGYAVCKGTSGYWGPFWFSISFIADEESPVWVNPERMYVHNKMWFT